ncbi:MAG: AAA family ATPase [Bacteroidota bacterium]|nr:AAA family ATPase [Bacteroidota bacterium]MDP4236463.1 AAA family ATPase [Bacteroidota bacterium]
MEETKNVITKREEKRYDAYSLKELRTTTISNTTLLDPFIPAVGIATVVGMPDSGKSMLCRNLALSIAFGKKTFLGLKLNSIHKRALFVTTEDTLEATKDCFVRMANSFKSPARAFHEENLHILLADDLTPDEIIERINEYLNEFDFDVIIVDAYGDVFKGGEGNSNIQNRNSLRPFSIIAKTYGVSIIFVHHTNKAAKFASPDQIHVQGGSGFVQKVRTVLELRPSRTQDEIRFLACTKGNGVPAEAKKRAIELEFDPNTFIYKETGNTIAVSDLKFEKDPEGTRHMIDGSLLFKESELTLTRAIIIGRIVEQYGVSERTAIRWIGENLTSTKLGTYENPNKKANSERATSSIS